MLVSDGSAWILIPSGDEPSGTVTSIAAGAGLNTTSNDTAIDGGTITSSGTIYLTKTGVTEGSYGDSTAQTPGYGSTFKVPYITVDKYGRITGASEHTVKIPECSSLFASILAIVPLQLLSYYVAKEKGLDVDKPRNLAKSVTVE